MEPLPSESGEATSHGPMRFVDRPSSTSWEKACIAESPQNIFWIWVKPPGLPQVLVLRIPDETYQSCPRHLLTMRELLRAVDVEPSSVVMWIVNGVLYESQMGRSACLDQAIPEPVEGTDPNITVCINLPVVGSTQPVTTPTCEASQELCLSELFEHIDADWQAILEIETELAAQRQKLIDTLNRLKVLNRDLSFQERLHASSRDQQDWLDARRWLRDASMRILNCVQQFDMGDATGGEQRNWCEQIYEQFIVRHQAFDGIELAQRDFEQHRKKVITLQTQMNNAYWHAIQNGEQRAQRVLNTIAAKIRDAQLKKNFLGVMLDSD